MSTFRTYRRRMGDPLPVQAIHWRRDFTAADVYRARTAYATWNTKDSRALWLTRRYDHRDLTEILTIRDALDDEAAS